jgi:glycosyltransferase involved in cell wall biosynthesis
MSVSVSVIIPTYNSGAWVEATLSSVLHQTGRHAELEVLVIDDASPDDSAGIARRFLEQHALRGRVIVREKNSGVASTRNLGWKMAGGDWIQFLDADDLLAPHKIDLQAQLAAQAAADVAVVYSNWQHFLLEDGQWQPSGPLNAPYVDDDPVLRTVQQPTFGYVGPTLIRKSFLALVGGFEEKPNIGEDTDLMLRLAIAGGQFREAHSETAAFLYRQSPNSLWRAYVKNAEAMRNLLHSIRRAEEFLRARSSDGGLSEEARLAVARRYSRFADFYLEHDPASFHLLMAWLRALGFKRPIELSRAFGLFSSLLGYETAVRLRSAYRKRRAWLR